MKLLFDANISPSLVLALANQFPGSRHVADLDMGSADDHDIWEAAKNGRFTICTKDTDFLDIATLLGPPPKVVFLRLGNATTAEIEFSIRQHRPALSRFASDEHQAVLIIGRDRMAK